METVPFHKIFTPRNQMEFRYFTQWERLQIAAPDAPLFAVNYTVMQSYFSFRNYLKHEVTKSFFWAIFCSEAVAWMCSFKKLFWKISVPKKLAGNYLCWGHFSSNTGGLDLHFYWNNYSIADVLRWILQKFSDQLFNRKTASSCLKNCC